VSPEPRQPAAGQRDRPANTTRENNQLLRAKLSEEQLAILTRYGSVEDTAIGQVLFSAGDPSYDLIVLLARQVEAFDRHGGQRCHIATLGPGTSWPS
jgi:hypothetical protein